MKTRSNDATAAEHEDMATAAVSEDNAPNGEAMDWGAAPSEPAAYQDGSAAPSGAWSNESGAYDAAAPTPGYQPDAGQSNAYDPDDSIDNCTVILRGTKLVGDLQTDEDIVIAGSIKGNVTTVGRISLGGQVIGDVQSQSIELAGAVIKGNISVENQVLMDKDTTVIGNIQGREAELAGRVKGNLAIEKLIYIRETAILMGNITSESVHIEEGAILMGDVVITPDRNGMVQVDEPDFEISIK